MGYEEIDSDLEIINKKIEAVKEKYWNPEWENMEESERFKDTSYTTMLYEILKINYDYAVKCYEKSIGTPYEKLLSNHVKETKKLLDFFV